MPITVRISIALGILVLGVFQASVYANDSAAEFGVGGIVFKEESKISLEREDLVIGDGKIEVSYIFRNNSNKALTTVVAFPIGAHEFPNDGATFLDFPDFSVEVDGNRLPFKTETHAWVGGKDYSKLLETLGIDAPKFGRSAQLDRNQFSELKMEDKQKLRDLKILGQGPDGQDDWPLYSVTLNHYWTQTFPAKKTISVKHSYWAKRGHAYINHWMDKIKEKDGIGFAEFRGEEIKLSREERASLENIHSDLDLGAQGDTWWVSYILKTANNWGGKIKEFNLKIEAPPNKLTLTNWEGELRRLSKDHIGTSVKDFSPTKNLLVVWVSPQRM